MRFFQILSRRERERVATRVTNSSEIRDKLKAARIAYFKRPGHYKQTWQTALWTRILFYQLFAFFFLMVKNKRRKKKRKGQRGSGTGILPSTSDGNYGRGYPGVSRVIAYAYMTKTQFQGLVAGWLHGRLSLRFCLKNFSSGDFFLAIF